MKAWFKMVQRGFDVRILQIFHPKPRSAQIDDIPLGKELGIDGLIIDKGSV